MMLIIMMGNVITGGGNDDYNGNSSYGEMIRMA